MHLSIYQSIKGLIMDLVLTLNVQISSFISATSAQISEFSPIYFVALLISVLHVRGLCLTTPWIKMQKQPPSRIVRVLFFTKKVDVGAPMSRTKARCVSRPEREWRKGRSLSDAVLYSRCSQILIISTALVLMEQVAVDFKTWWLSN